MIGAFPEAEFLKLHRALAVTPGPSLNEAPRRAVLERVFHDNGLPAQVDSAGNLWVGIGSGGAWGDTVVFDAHIDVVEKGFTADVEVTPEHLSGLGVGDDLVAVTMLALAACRLRAPAVSLTRPLRLLFSVGEEGLGNLSGVRGMVADHAAAPYLFIAFDGTLDTYSITGLGSRRYRIDFQCEGGHSWGSFGVPSATEELVLFLHRLRLAYRELVRTETATLSFNIGTVEGGEGINSISRFAAATFEFRSASPGLLDRAGATVAGLGREWSDREGVKTQLAVIGERPAAESVDAARIRGLVEPILRAQSPELEAVVMSTNINIPLAHGWPAVRIGLYRGRHAHREDEQVDRDSLPVGWSILDSLCHALLT